MEYIKFLFLIFSLVVIIYNIKIGKNINNDLLEKSQSNVVRGICSVIVILVHIQPIHGNPIQDLVGSFRICMRNNFFLIISIWAQI